jgi:hypothetical protein
MADQAKAPAARRAAQRQPSGPGPSGPAPAEPGPAGGAQGADSAAAGPPRAGAWLVADAPLFIYHPEAGAAPARAYNPGDRVPAELVERYDWHDQTHVPEWASAPPAPAPDTTSSEEQT